jgi:hypothetical protein
MIMLEFLRRLFTMTGRAEALFPGLMMALEPMTDPADRHGDPDFEDDNDYYWDLY